MRAAAGVAEADRLKRENDAQRAAAQAALDSAASQKAQLENKKILLTNYINIDSSQMSNTGKLLEIKLLVQNTVYKVEY